MRQSGAVPAMGSGPIDPKELLKGLDCFLGRDGEVKTMDGISKIFSLMKDSQKMVSRCIYLNILLQTRAQDILAKFIRIGGYKLLNTWLTGSKANNNVPFLQQLLLTLQHLPLTVDHLKQLRRLASILVSDWMGVIRSQSSSQPTERDKKKRKEENKSKTPVPEKPQETKNEAKNEEIPEKKREKPKSLRTTAPSHAKFRSTAPVPGIKIKKKKKVLSPTAAKPSPFEGKPAPEPSTAKPSSPEPAAAEPMDTDRPGTPVPAIEVPEPMDTGSSEAGGDPKATDVPSEGGAAPRRTRKKKSVSWPEEGRLREYFYFELDETEREKPTELFSPLSIPDSPHEPDPESYEPLPPKLIPLDEDCSGEDGAYPEGLDPGNSAASPEPGAGAKLPPVLANLMGSVGAGKGPPGPPQNAPINMQEILSSIMPPYMSSRAVCRHFMLKGSCRYENNCAFYHPGVNGPPLP
ncbi:Serine/threonine-protein phosphatase 1 regulatory subunit 10 [Lonchura striata]|uniref:Serine/threonine-protein phosphatase 1 regulatory subunit 10 n=1 Tax=Lonchura striata TaxID=40157 RepID=A0A218U7U3_9PASE|nr:Serine/threonine-protein phosphatase 1 regulatory subunit 10 [Lonchura striata domestica]